MLYHENQFYKNKEKWYNKNMKKNGTTEYYEEIETTKEYDGYFCSVSEAITNSGLSTENRTEII